MKQNSPSALVWYRRDLRVRDHPGLRQAADDFSSVIPCYVLSQWEGEHRWTGSNRQSFLCQCLRSLAGNLEVAGSRLILRTGAAEEELPRLAAEVGAKVVFAHREVDPFGRQVEDKLRRRLAEMGVELRLHKDLCAFEQDEVLTGGGEPYRVFTPYSRAWRKLEPASPGATVRALPPVPTELPSAELPDLAQWKLPPPGSGVLAGGERAARERMKTFLAGPAARYGDLRDLPAEAGTSRLSQDLRFGLLSIRELLQRSRAAMEGQSPARVEHLRKFETELIWREFYQQLLWHFPRVLEEEFSPKFRGLHWPGGQAALERWQNGETGFPIVDAGLRELRETGFMHNRVRMITAMFLTKDLHVDWREGESWFMRQLVDGEIASNNGGWQWSAGTGADAAPYFRIQNPWTQTKRYDPEGKYIRRWVPELRNVPARALQAPPEDGQSLAPGYPQPMVDHDTERKKTLEIFANHRAK
jgi:deoxyribodipyrimidine photo-lyase